MTLRLHIMSLRMTCAQSNSPGANTGAESAVYDMSLITQPHIIILAMLHHCMCNGGVSKVAMNLVIAG